MLGSKPCLVFLGSPFTTNPEFVKIKNVLADFFRGPVVENINLGVFPCLHAKDSCL